MDLSCFLIPLIFELLQWIVRLAGLSLATSSCMMMTRSAMICTYVSSRLRWASILARDAKEYGTYRKRERIKEIDRSCVLLAGQYVSTTSLTYHPISRQLFMVWSSGVALQSLLAVNNWCPAVSGGSWLSVANPYTCKNVFESVDLAAPAPPGMKYEREGRSMMSDCVGCGFRNKFSTCLASHRIVEMMEPRELREAGRNVWESSDWSFEKRTIGNGRATAVTEVISSVMVDPFTDSCPLLQLASSNSRPRAWET